MPWPQQHESSFNTLTVQNEYVHLRYYSGGVFTTHPRQSSCLIGSQAVSSPPFETRCVASHQSVCSSLGWGAHPAKPSFRTCRSITVCPLTHNHTCSVHCSNQPLPTHVPTTMRSIAIVTSGCTPKHVVMYSVDESESLQNGCRREAGRLPVVLCPVWDMAVRAA
jgi:hypothetical protein